MCMSGKKKKPPPQATLHYKRSMYQELSKACKQSTRKVPLQKEMHCALSNKKSWSMMASSPPPASSPLKENVSRRKRQKKELLRMGFEPTVFALLFDMLEWGFLIQ